MINLIPKNAKKSLIFEYWVRVISSWLLVWSIALLASAAIILPAYVLIGYQVDNYQESAAEVSEKVATFENVSTQLVRSSVEARIIVDQTNLANFSDYITLFDNLRGDGVDLSQISLSRAETGLSPVLLAGTARDRQSLTSFRDRLLADERIESVDFPISNLAQDRDIRFTITVKFNNKPIDV